MTQLVAKIILAVLLLPVSHILHMFVSYAVWFSSTGQQSILISSITALGEFICAVAYWWLLWRSSVRWTPSRVRRTWIAIALTVAVGAVALGFMAAITSMPASAATDAVYAMPVVWILGTVFILRETPSTTTLERLKRTGSF